MGAGRAMACVVAKARRRMAVYRDVFMVFLGDIGLEFSTKTECVPCGLTRRAVCMEIGMDGAFRHVKCGRIFEANKGNSHAEEGNLARV